MARTEQPGAVTLSGEDITQAMELSSEAGWNQIPDDWRVFLAQGKIFGLFEGTVLAATAAIIPYGKDITWIGMVLTRKVFRGRGFGTALLKRCMAEIKAEGRTAFLDATPAGEPIYRSLGFEAVETFTRWQGMGGGSQTMPSGESDTVAIQVANAAFGADQTFLLKDFARRCPQARRSTRNAHAFGRDGRIATQIGPVVGPDEEAIAGLVETVIASLQGPVFLDVAERCPILIARLEAARFERQRTFLRMKKGPHVTPRNEADVAVIAGPEFG